MNAALIYLWLVLLKGQARQFVRNLRRPTTLLGFAALAFAFGVLFHFRHAEGFGQVVRRESILGAVLVMLGGSFFKGFLQRGLVFELADVEFVFTSPFTRRQVVLYRLLPGYLYAAVQSAVFFVLFASHLEHPVIVSLGLALLQAACFHVAAGASIYAGSISDRTHHRLKWMLLFLYFMVVALYLRGAWGLRLVPSFMSSLLAQCFFYPAAPLLEAGIAPAVGRWAFQLVGGQWAGTQTLLEPLGCLVFLGFAALVTLGLVFRLKANLFETSLATSSAAEERRARLRSGRSLADPTEGALRSLAIPKLLVFRGAGAIVWKNLVAALRSKRQLWLATFFTVVYTGFLLALRWILHREMAAGGEFPQNELRDFDKGIAGMLAALVFFLQRAFPFDFRRDGPHLVEFRTLPISPLAVVLAELAVPTMLCLLFQAAGIAVLFVFGRFDLLLVIFVLLAFPAVALALNAVWNLHYLLATSRRAGGRSESASPVGLVMVVALSFLVFYPAGWAALEVGRHTFGRSSELIASAAWLAVQYAVDALLILVLASLFQRFEVARDS